ncbi:MAG: IS630 family transposase [Thermomicrobiales bacterium]
MLDQSGFAPTLPTGSTWGRLGQRLVVPYEAPQRRRVNVAGALAPYDPAGPHLCFESRRTQDGPYTATAHLAFVRHLVPASQRQRPCVVLLDNYSVHHSRTVTDALPELAAVGITFCLLPPYIPKLNPIEAVWRQVKYQDLPERSYPTDTALQTAGDAALIARAAHLRNSAKNLHEPA